MKNYTDSDIFNSYIELAEKKGLVSLAEEDADDSKQALDKNPRADSLSKEEISKLYNVKPDAPKGMDYDRNIGQLAHKTPVVIGPSYDKLNALVESDNERQDILLRIVDKRTNGLLTQHKYAQDEMVRSLVRIANEMDNRNESELCALADECLKSFSKYATGTGLDDLVGPETSAILHGGLRADVALAGLGILVGTMFPAVVGASGILAGASAGGLGGARIGLVVGPLLAAIFGTGKIVKSLNQTSKDAIKEIGEILSDKDISGSKYKELFVKFKQDLENLIKASDDFLKEEAAIKNSLQNKDQNNESYYRAAKSYPALDNAITEVENDIKEFTENYELIIDESLKSDYAGIELFQKIDRFLQPTFKDLSDERTLYLECQDLTKLIKEFDKQHNLNHKSVANALDNAEKKVRDKASEMGISLPSSSNSVNEDEILTSAAAKKMVQFIKNH